MNDLYNTINEEYSPSYCHLLEEVYGYGMMSEGGANGIEQMFSTVDIKNKKCLDFGCGLGGVALYLAEQHNAEVVGLEINPWMISEATKRIPKHLKERISYKQSASDSTLDFPDASFDIVYSKGVLTHLPEKEALFKEFKRILKPGGTLVIVDWLSPIQGEWGNNILEMAEIEALTLFAVTTDNYLDILKKTSFKNITHNDLSLQYQHYNEEICHSLEKKKDKFFDFLGEEGYKDNLKGYQLIAQAFKEQELLAIKFIAHT